MFNNVSLDGYFAGVNGDISWVHKDRRDEEWESFVADNARGGGTLLFGRVTYELMAAYWPTPEAARDFPEVAGQMNGLPKIVFSRTLAHAAWSNATVVKRPLIAEVRELKNAPGAEMVILGSGSIVAQLAPENLIDEYQLVVNPVVLGKGRTMFEGLKTLLRLRLTKTRAFSNGNVLLCYAPAL